MLVILESSYLPWIPGECVLEEMALLTVDGLGFAKDLIMPT